MYQKDLPTVPEAFYCTVERFPDRPAQRFNPELYQHDNGGAFTYSEMRERVEKIACGLMAMGFENHGRAAIMSPSSPYWTHADLAIAAAGGVSITIYPTLSEHEVLYIMNDSESEYLFLGNERLLALLQPEFPKMPKLKKTIIMDITFKSFNDKVMGLGELMALGEEWRRDHASEYRDRWQSVTLDHWYTILYTSGTTGQGKGVVLPHWSPSSRMLGVSRYFAEHGMTLTENDVTLSFLPLSHIFDRGSCQLTAIWVGACICYGDKPATIVADMQKYNPTWFNCVPRLYEKIYMQMNEAMAGNTMKKKMFEWAVGVGMQALEYRKDANGHYNMSPDFDFLSKMPLTLRIQFKVADKLFANVRALFGQRFRFSFSASAGIAADLLKFYYAMGLAVCEGYGSTESFNACTLNPLDACKPGSIGPDANGGISRVASDGELELSGAGIFKAYLNKPAETAEAFTADGWFKTGDVVVKDSDGYYRMVDRKKAIICLATGKNVAPAKIENLFATSPFIEQVFCIGDERPVISSLIVPNFNYFMTIFEREGVCYDEDALVWSEATGAPICTAVGADFIDHPLLKGIIEQEIHAANEKLEKHERIKQHTIINSRFTEENAMLTPTQKAKKKVILDVYKDAVEKMYE